MDALIWPRLLTATRKFSMRWRLRDYRALPRHTLRNSASLLETERSATFSSLSITKKIGGRLINSHWRIVHLGPGDGSLVLSDRPLVRLFGYEHPKASWFLPLGPRAVFCAVNCPKDFDRLTPRKLARSLNVDSVRQVQKYAFCVDGGHNRLLERHLPPRDRP